MSFYSSLDMVANRVDRVPTSAEVFALLDATGVRDLATGHLAPDLAAVFHDEQARAENNRFFRPGELGFAEQIEVIWWDGSYQGPGYSISISGYGYFFPWELADIRDRFLALPKLVRFREKVNERFGGGFTFPDDLEDPLHERLLSDQSGWVWFGTES